MRITYVRAGSHLLYTAAREMLSKFSVRCTCRCIVPWQSPKLGSLARSLIRSRVGG